MNSSWNSSETYCNVNESSFTSHSTVSGDVADVAALEYSLNANFSRTPMAVLLSAVAVCSNLLVMICIAKEKKLRRPANYYVFSMSLTECIVGLIPVNGLLVLDAYSGWPLGSLLCKVRKSYLVRTVLPDYVFKNAYH
jgi:7 transmembrane receptor (rhodopsin family)